MASLLFVLLGKRQWHPHHILQDLPAPTTSEERRGHTVLWPLWNPLSGAPVQAPIGGQRALGLLLALRSQSARGAPLASPWVTSFPETLQVSCSFPPATTWHFPKELAVGQEADLSLLPLQMAVKQVPVPSSPSTALWLVTLQKLTTAEQHPFPCCISRIVTPATVQQASCMCLAPY